MLTKVFLTWTLREFFGQNVFCSFYNQKLSKGGKRIQKKRNKIFIELIVATKFSEHTPYTTFNESNLKICLEEIFFKLLIYNKYK